MEYHIPILIMAGAVGFYMAWSIGANDVANAMGTVVGAKTLTLRQAVVVAGIMNVLGAVFVGGHVTSTIRKGVIDPELFKDCPELLLLGMFAVLIGAASWVTLSTWLRLPVSTTHSIVGALVGFGIASVGIGSIKWGTILFIIGSWVVSPILGGLISYAVFMVIRKRILNSVTPIKAAIRIGPFFIGLVFFVLSMMVIFKGLKPLKLDFDLKSAFAISTGVAVAATIGGYLLLKWLRPADNGKYESVEQLARPLHILSASCESFAHGANDVANAIAPVAAVLLIIQTGSVGAKAPTPLYVLILGGIGIMLGVSTWGYRIMGTIGKEITEITPTRGFAAEFGTATTVLLCSRFGLPVSTTHTSVGNVVGVGLARGFSALNLRVIWKIIQAWVITLPAAGVFSIVIFWALKLIFLRG